MVLRNKRKLYTVRSESNGLDPQCNGVTVDNKFLLKPKKW